jgi:hypothetical protein
LGERLLCKQEVIGSIPFTSTSQWSGILRYPVVRYQVSGERQDREKQVLPAAAAAGVGSLTE